MSLTCPLVHVEDVAPQNMHKREGWAISEFRLPISGRQGAATTVFHSIFRPGSTHAKHLHARCDEIAWDARALWRHAERFGEEQFAARLEAVIERALKKSREAVSGMR